MLLKKIAGPVAIACMTLGFTTAASTPAWAASDVTAPAPPPAAKAALIMPEVRGLILQRAVRTVHASTDNAELDLRFVNRKDVREVINQQNWEVCAQSPAAGRAIPQKTMRVTLYVKRPDSRGCS